MEKFKEHFGKEAEDKITGFKGIISGYAHYITGCGQYLINPKVDEKGNEVDGKWIDEGRLAYSNEVKVQIGEVVGDDNGCDKSPALR